MSIEFNYSPYLGIIKENPQFYHDSEIQEYANESPKFHYGNVTYKKFKVSPNLDAHIGRNPLANIPLAVWSGVAKVIYHLAKVIFYLFREVFSKSKRRLQANSLALVRDLQETFGYMIRTFNVEAGNYHVQEAIFQKTCYECFANKNIPTASNLNNKNDLYSFLNFVDDLDDYFIEEELNMTESELDQALEAAKDIETGEEKNKKIFQIVNNYIQIECLDKALEVNNNFQEDVDKKIERALTIASIHFRRNQRNKVTQIIDSFYVTPDIETRDRFLYDLQFLHTANDNFDKATLSAAKIADHELKENSLFEIAQICYDQKNWIESLKALDRVHLREDDKLEFIEGVVDASYNEGELESILKTFNESDSLEMYDLLHITAAQQYLSQGEKARASQLISPYETSIFYYDSCYEQLVQFYYIAGDFSKAFCKIIPIWESHSDLAHELIWKIVEELLEVETKKVYGGLPEFSSSSMSTRDQFITTIARECYAIGQQYVDYKKRYSFPFNNWNSEDIFKIIQDKITNPQTINIFYHLPNPTAIPPTHFTASPYEILGIDYNASVAQIKKAYNKLALRYHPDKIKKNESESDTDFGKRKLNNEEQFKKISNAYQTLTK